MAETIGLTPYLARKPHALSGGQRQRVALGRAIVREPKVFLFDEPLSNLDAALRVSTRAEIARLHRALGATMIYVTHDQVEAMTMGTRICIMNSGRVAQVGAPLEVYNRPADTFVAAFLGNPPMNLLPARGTGEGDGRVLIAGENRVALPADRCPPIRAGETVTLGIRPEHLVPEAPGAGAVALAGIAAGAERHGAETLLSVTLTGLSVPVIARVPGQLAPTPGAPCALRFDPVDAHVFAVDGRALRP